ncbi:phosphate acyltransferase PlsX [Kiloniella laminariae]|uniref:phosphate acyltransferase PlsX n=1 Tax=Kiloniella laminariae TaxID=454162 RepID=UPI00068727DA|nr:phosphate acyltransferase PlsX [Kiloniella laminariae]
MSARITIALDAMGGDDAPGIVVQGAEIASQRYPDVQFLIFGHEKEVLPLIEQTTRLKKVVEFVHADDKVLSDDKPAVALRSRRKSSMRLAINAVHEGRADGIVSAGNTGALMAMSKFVLKTLPGVDRPAIASFFPTLRGESLMLDLGANLSCDADNLFDFAVMGNAFARCVLGVQEPSVGILNVGSEDVKGHEYLQVASSMLRQADLPGEFVGFVEGDDIGKGTVDVIVTDGFTGNVALKTAEGTAKLITEFFRQSFKSSLLASLGYILASSALGKLKKRVDPRLYNGAIFLGLNGIAVKSHGGTDAVGFANAIAVAVDMRQQDIIKKIREDFDSLTRETLNEQAAFE